MAALQGQIASRLNVPPRVEPVKRAEEAALPPAAVETVADPAVGGAGPAAGEITPPAGPPQAGAGTAGARPAGEGLSRRKLPLPWVVTGLVVLAGLCGLIGLAMAGGFTLMPGLLARANETPVSTTPAQAASAQVTLEAMITPEEISRLPETEVAALPETAVPEETPPEGTQPAESTFFEDDFSNPDSGWFIGQEDGSDIYYDQGGYRILVDRPNIIAWATPDLYFSDVSLEVDATKVAGADENLFGLVCRYQDEQNFYLLVIGSDGWYEIGKYKDGKYSQIEETAGYNGAIHRGRTSNRIRADCIRNTLTLYINDLRLVRVTDNDFAAGDVGLTAAAFKIGNTNILFDNFVARKP
jgi:hypothetical protein